MHTSEQKNHLSYKQQPQPLLVFLLMSPLPAASSPPFAFPVSARFRLVFCASWVMDYLSAVSQYNDIQCCSPSCTVRSKDEASLHFLFGSPELLLLGFGVSFVDFQLSSLSRFSYSTVRLGLRPHYTDILCLFLSREIRTFEIPKIIRLFSFSIHTVHYTV